MVQTSNLRYAYPDSETLKFPDINIKPEEHLLILGESGVGKTTLLYLMAGLLPAKEGSAFIAGTELNKLSVSQLDKFRGEAIGLVFQQYHFIKSLSVAENLKLRHSYPIKTTDDKRLIELSERLGLKAHLNKKVTALSQGQQQRLSIALGLIHKPKVVFADEPTSNLDDTNCSIVIELLKEEAKLCKSSLVIITHDLRVKSHFENQISL